jgi:sRNA-binding carbon storage regulator CsrA
MNSVEIGNAHFTVLHGDRLKIGDDIELYISKPKGRSVLRILVQAPKQIRIVHKKRRREESREAPPDDGVGV